MQEDVLLPDLVTYNAAIAACSHHARWTALADCSGYSMI